MIRATNLSFNILDTYSCQTFAIYDTSYYSQNQTIANATLQVVSPYSDIPVELDYYKNAVTLLNRNTGKITKVKDGA